MNVVVVCYLLSEPLASALMQKIGKTDASPSVQVRRLSTPQKAPLPTSSSMFLARCPQFCFQQPCEGTDGNLGPDGESAELAGRALQFHFLLYCMVNYFCIGENTKRNPSQNTEQPKYIVLCKQFGDKSLNLQGH